jgi:hypothetical protein
MVFWDSKLQIGTKSKDRGVLREGRERLRRALFLKFLERFKDSYINETINWFWNTFDTSIVKELKKDLGTEQ